MANSVKPQSAWSSAFRWRPLRLSLGTTISGSIFLLITGLFVSLLWAGQNFPTSNLNSTRIIELIWGGAVQAATSTILSLIIGAILAISINRLHFRGRNLVIAVLSSALVLPSLVLIAGLIAIWGRSGLANQALSFFDTKLPFTIFGFWGIIFAHVILNGAYAARLFLDRLDAIPPSTLKLGRGLNLSTLQRIRILDLRAIMSSVPALAATIFLICFTSFAIVLTLGGGPANQTLEVAIYEAIRRDFDINAAVTLAIVQLVISLAIVIPASRLNAPSMLYGTTVKNLWPTRGLQKSINISVLSICLFLLAAPIVITLYRGLGSALWPLLAKPTFWNAFWSSLIIATLSSSLCLVLALGLSAARALLPARSILATLLGLPVFAYLVVPSVVLSLGFFIASHALHIPTQTAAPVVLIIANALLSLPFVFASIAPPLAALHTAQHKLIRSLNISSKQQFFVLELPLLSRPLGYGFAVAFVFSLGDLGVISIFGTSEFSTLPWLMYRSLGAYRSNDADAIAAIMLIISLTSFFFLPKLIEWFSHAVRK